MKPLYLHIGLPKTATTTLQQSLFPFLEDIDYIGTCQPRAQNKDHAIFCNMISLIDSPSENIFAASLPRLIAEIEAYLENTEHPVLLSEECLTLGNGNLTWQEKLERLARITAHLNPTILVTTRDPIEASFSFFTELYLNIHKIHSNPISFALNSNHAQIYRYQELDARLNRLFNGNLQYVDFSLLKNGSFYQEILQAINSKSAIPEFIPQSNKRSKNTSGTTLLYTNEDAKKYLLKKHNRTLYALTKFKPTKRLFERKIYRELNTLKEQNKVYIPFLTEEEKKLLTNFYKEDIKFLNGISTKTSSVAA